jgi:ppGpp synthetase/RelA/SpoT-type nucleotidyltranferase
MDFDTYTRSKHADYQALAETVSAIVQAAIAAHPGALRLQQVQQRAKDPVSLRKKLENRGILASTTLEDDIKDLAGCRLIFYTNTDVSRFLQSGIIQDNFEVDWDRTKIHHPVPGQTEADNLFISNNYVVKLKSDRTALPEYAHFAGLRCEVQVQTTLNHAWAEMNRIIYKKPPVEGFGSELFKAIEARLQKIMKEHLLPAGYEFQKVLDNTQRLLRGKELLDRGALKALAECSDNNARYELLERFRDYVLPNYNDLQSVYPEMKDQLVAAVKAARLAQPRPFETPFGNYPGITVERLVDLVGDILTYLRYVNVELTFDAICELYPDARSDEERKHLLGVTERLARNNLDVWKQAGPYVPTVLVQNIRAVDKARSDPLRPVLLEVLSEALKPDLHGVSSTYKSVMLRQGSAAASDALARMRAEAIDLLTELYRTASSDAEKQRTEAALFEATRTPGTSGYSADLLACILRNSATVVDFFAAVAPTDPYEILQAVERKVLWLHQRNQDIGGVMGADPAVLKARETLDASILKFRKALDANKGFAIYKTLVGFESVFPAAWDDPNFQYEQEADYREQRIGEFVEQIDKANAEEWFAIIERCAQTESNDLATFPVFGQFLQRLSRAKPKVVLVSSRGWTSA